MRCNAGPCRSMAEEPKPEVAVEQEAAATNGDGDAAAKSGKSFEERLAELKKPEAVPQPKEDEVNAQLSKLNSEITTWDKRLTEIKSAIEKASAARDGGRSESKDIVEKLKAVRAKIKAASSEREDVFQQLRELTQARQLQANAATDASASVPAHRMSTEEIEYARAQARAALNELAAQRAAAARGSELASQMGQRGRANSATDLAVQRAAAAPPHFHRGGCDEEISVAAVREKVERGELVQGSLRVNAKNPSEAFVSVQGYSRDVAIVGPQNRGRALEGDVVAVALLPREPGRCAGERGACGSGDVQWKGRVVSVVQAMHRLIHIGHLRACFSAAAPAQPGLEFISHDGRYPAFEVRADECSGEVLQHIHGAGAHMLLSARITGWPAGAAGPRAQVLDVQGRACIDHL